MCLRKLGTNFKNKFYKSYQLFQPITNHYFYFSKKLREYIILCNKNKQREIISLETSSKFEVGMV